MRFHVESWAPEYGSPAEDPMAVSTTEVDVAGEVAADAWAPLDPAPGAAEGLGAIAFVDGVRRVDARVWVEDVTTGAVCLGVCASYAAGAVRSNGRATVAAAAVERGVFCASPSVETIDAGRAAVYTARPADGEAPEQLWLAVQAQMGLLEAKAAVEAGAGDDVGLVVVDGPLSDRRVVPGVVGYVKSHHVRYLDPGHEEVVAALRPGQRTPLFRLGGRFARWSWYLRLPHGRGHPWSGIVRVEAPPDLTLDDARRRADVTAGVLPRFASEPHKDPRAPQNLHPIAGLERHLRRRLGDPALLERRLRRAAATR